MSDALFAGLRGISDAAASFSTLVAGGVGVNEHGGQALIKAIDKMLDGVTRALRQSHIIGQEPPLGTTPAAQVYKPYLATIATDPVQGFITAAQELKEKLVQMRSDVEQAMAVYQTTEQDNEQRFAMPGGPTLSA
ncbi:hypothetical protein [Saccharothrix variisporea]|uniref:Excreted virulence factor EspC (Type VII ESX diderm) n=1 Tax=Saccharothrix variisporea TaxID=543527 RepID=A0A495XHG6_9PSEU|nr:hypothetical protein [Saccharothrix variisporea]RKT73780.1 hypothetical protein DFJ66_7117 [Saccharothrix variisporea]